MHAGLPQGLTRGMATLGRWALLGVLLLSGSAEAEAAVAGNAAAPNAPVVVVVVGAGGEQEYAEAFSEWSTSVRKAAQQGMAELHEIGLTNIAGAPDRERLQGTLAGLAPEGASAVWILMVGHGTYDGREARFNLRGPDVTAGELASWLDRFKRPLVVVNCASASGAFLKALSKEGRVVVVSTKSGYEQNYSRFGSYFTAALVDVKADLDKDGQVSLLEAFLFASAGVREFYKAEQRLASEHAMIDDNGDGLGTPADWFRGVQTNQKARDGTPVDGRRAHQFHLVMSGEERDWDPARIARRDALELEVWQLKDRKTEMNQEEYYTALEKLLVQLARVSQAWTNAAK